MSFQHANSETEPLPAVFKPGHGPGFARVLVVLSYDPEPGKMLTEHTRKISYGRVA